MSAEKIPQEKRLSATRPLTRSPVRRIEWDVVVPIDTDVEDIMEPGWLVHHVGSTFSGPINFLTVHWDDKSRLATFYVRRYEKDFARLELMDYWNFEKDEEVETPGEFVIGWHGPKDQYRIDRKDSGQIVMGGFATRGDAVRYLSEQKNLVK